MKKLRQATDLLGWQESNVAIGHGKLKKNPFYTNKIFTFKRLVSWLFRLTVFNHIKLYYLFLET
jgi:hypothetical protein